ncbi:ankyrin and armadillo repeat-containing protein isoform X2 [Pseudophryne corroboree]|uniref:ankyrin and armadillo repeat-containing protein isoform X2 n=1 Tax=Pseudophryne corroboree TaxID=495146 RepID=UPI003081B429
MLRSVKKPLIKAPVHDEAFMAEMTVQRNASAFFDKFDRSEVQELLAHTISSWLVSKDDAHLPLHLPSGLITQLKNLTHPNVLVLAPVEPEVRLDYREVHQILRELVIGIYCFNQVPSICLNASYDCSTSCQLPPAYYDTRVGQILISVDYMIKALWHGSYMAEEKRSRFSELWRSSMDIDANGHPQTKKNIFADFCLADDKVRTERELPPLMLGQEFKCQHFQYSPNEYFHLHGGIEFDLGTPPLENTSEEIKAAYGDICNTAINHITSLLDLHTTYREHYPIPVMKFNGKSYHVIAIELEDFYQTTLTKQWWGSMNGIISSLKPKRLPLTDTQLHEQFKKVFGYKKAIKCKNLPFGLRAAAERGMAAIFYTFCRKTQISGLNDLDDAGYAILHHAAVHNRASVVSQLAKAGLNLNQRRRDNYLTQGELQNAETVAERTGPTALHLAAKCGSLEVLSCLLALNTDYTLCDKRGWTAIHYAAFYGNIPCIRALYRKDASLLELETAGQHRSTPLLLTATSGAHDALRHLLSLGADWRRTDSMGNNIIHLAVLFFHTHILTYVIELHIPELHVWQHLAEMLKCNDSYRTEMAARCLEVLSVVKERYWRDIYEAGSIPCLVNLLRSGQVNLECVATGILSNISHNVTVAKALEEAEAVPILIALLHSKRAELQSRCAVILSDIAQVEGHQNLIAQLDGISPLVQLLQEELEDVLVNAINCIRVLCSKNPANQKTVRDLGGIPLLVEFLGDKSDVLLGAASAAIAEMSRGNKLIQDAIAQENAVVSLINIIQQKKLHIQVKAAMAVEALADHNAAIQREFLDRSVWKHILKLLKVFQLEVREQGSTTLWALAGQTWKQQKAMAERIGCNFIIDMLLSPSDKMQYVGGQAIIALCKDSKHHQDQLCEGNGIGPLVRLLRNSRVAEGTLISVIKALGTMCIGVALIHNPVTQERIVEERALPTLVHLLKTHSSTKIKVEVGCTLACIVLRNASLQDRLHLEGFTYPDVLDLLYDSDQDMCLRAGYALALFAYNNTLQQFYILENRGIDISIYEPFLQSADESDKASAAFQTVVLARIIVGMDQVTLSARGVTILSELLQSRSSSTVVLAGELLASLAHTRAGIPDAITTLGTVECLCSHLQSEDEEVRVACANALGYLTFNRTAYRHLLTECRNRPALYNLLICHLSTDAKISKEFTEEFNTHRRIGLPSLSLAVNGGPPISPSLWKGPHCKDTERYYWRNHCRSKSATATLSQRPGIGSASNQDRPNLAAAVAATRPKTTNLGHLKPFQQKIMQ